MHSSLIGKIEKAKRYAEEPERIRFSSFSVDFRGDHGSYRVNYQQDTPTCSCEFYSTYGVCSHTMAVQRVLEVLLPTPVSAA